MDLSRGVTSLLRMEVRETQPDGTKKTLRVITVSQELGPDGEPIGPCREEEEDG